MGRRIDKDPGPVSDHKVFREVDIPRILELAAELDLLPVNLDVAGWSEQLFDDKRLLKQSMFRNLFDQVWLYLVLILFEPPFCVGHLESLLPQSDCEHVDAGDTGMEVFHANAKYKSIYFFDFRGSPIKLKNRELFRENCLGTVLAQHVSLLVRGEKLELVDWA